MSRRLINLSLCALYLLFSLAAHWSLWVGLRTAEARREAAWVTAMTRFRLERLAEREAAVDRQEAALRASVRTSR